MDLYELFNLGKKIFGIVFCAFPVVSLLMWLIPQNMKNRVFLFLGVLLLFALVIMPSKLNLSKGLDRIKGATTNGGGGIGGGSGYGGTDISYGQTSTKGLGERVIDGVTTGMRKGKDGVIGYVDERINSQQVIPSRHNDVDRWGYDNKYYRQIDRGYNINIMDDIRLEQRNVRGLLGRSIADITFYNKGLFNSGYGNIEVLVISYDKYGDYLGERIEVLNGLCICKSDKYREKLQISRDTDEIIVKMLRATPCECREWEDRANRQRDKAQKEYNKANQRNLEKQYKSWESEQSKQRKEMDRLMEQDRKAAEKEYDKYLAELEKRNKKAQSKNKSKSKNKKGKNKGGSYVHDHDGYGPHTHNETPYEADNHSHDGGGQQRQESQWGQYQREQYEREQYQKAQQQNYDYPDYDEFMRSRNAAIPPNVEYSEVRPNHVEAYCDCRQCKLKRGNDYNFNYKN